MTDEHLISTVIDTARAVFKQPALDYAPTQIFREIRGFDSVLAVQFILAIEQALDVMLSEEEVDRMDTMGDLLDVLRAKSGSAAAD